MRSTPLAADLDEACRREPSRPAITFRDDTLSYSELWQRLSRLAASYLELGVRPGDRVVCQLPDGIEHIVAVGAAWAVAALHVGVDHDLTPDELIVLLDQADARALRYQPRADATDLHGALARIDRARPGTQLLVNTAAPPDLGGVHRLGDLLHADVPRDSRCHRPRSRSRQAAERSGAHRRPGRQPLAAGRRGGRDRVRRRPPVKLRFVVGDYTSLTREPCSCGRTHTRALGGFLGRADDMLNVRGVTLFPSSVEDAVRSVPGAGDEFAVEIGTKHELDVLTVRVESMPGTDEALLAAAVEQEVRSRCELRPVVEVLAHGTLPPTEGKARRVTDLRAG